ncbi:MAG: hypothetical protein EBV03_06060 [Proteobacteria bacterium]|nr:hypothetical protein [Pseudomonadota bacterium]
MTRLLPLILFLSLFSADAQAGVLLFQPQNPAVFAGANPGGNAALLASTVRPKDPRTTSFGANSLNVGLLVQQSVVGQISSKINDQIFNSAPGAFGSFPISGYNIQYVNNGGVLTVTFTDANGATTSVTLNQ